MSEILESVVVENVEPLKKKGRPSKSETDLNEKIIDLKTPAATKPARQKKKIASAEELATSAKNLQGLHLMLSMMTGLPEAQLTNSESVALAGALEKVSQEYGLALDGKTGAFLQLAGTAAIIYVPRALAVRARLAKQKEENKDLGENHGANS